MTPSVALLQIHAVFHCAYPPIKDLRTQFWSLFDWLPDDQDSDLCLFINQHSVHQVTEFISVPAVPGSA